MNKPTTEKFNELIRDLYNFQGGNSFALRLEKILESLPLDAAKNVTAPSDDEIENFEKAMRALGYEEKCFDSFHSEGKPAYYDKTTNCMLDAWLARTPDAVNAAPASEVLNEYWGIYRTCKDGSSGWMRDPGEYVALYWPKEKAEQMCINAEYEPRKVLVVVAAPCGGSGAHQVTSQNGELKALATAVASAAERRGIIAPGTPLTGPQLILLCNDLAAEHVASVPEPALPAFIYNGQRGADLEFEVEGYDFGTAFYAGPPVATGKTGDLAAKVECAICDDEGMIWVDGCMDACSACQDITDDSVAEPIEPGQG